MERGDLTYTLGDIAFLRRMWDTEMNDDNKRVIRQMIASGQLEIVEGGIVQPDEATTNYADVLRNFAAGHDWLMETFGIKPKVGWQLDPWGHSSAMAMIFAELGLESMYMARIEPAIKNHL